MWNEFKYDKNDIGDFMMDFLGYDLGYEKCIIILVLINVVVRIINFIFFYFKATKLRSF